MQLRSRMYRIILPVKNLSYLALMERDTHIESFALVQVVHLIFLLSSRLCLVFPSISSQKIIIHHIQSFN